MSKVYVYTHNYASLQDLGGGLGAGTFYKKIGCFNHWMVTLVADKLRWQWLWA